MSAKALVPTAKEINDAHRLAKDRAEAAIEWAVKCGQLLAAKKMDLQRGEFDAWVEKHCDFSRSSAYAYMKVSSKSSRGLDDLRSIQHALGYDNPKPKAKELPERAVPVVNPKGTGETGNDRPAAPVSPVAVEPAPDFDLEGYEPEEDDAYRANVENVLMADDKLAAMTEELKQCHREIQALKASRDHYQAQAGEAVRLVKARDREIEKLKRELERRRAA